MGKKQNNPDNLITEFLVRLLDKETAELLDAAMKTGKWKNRNALVNECIKGYLLYQQQIANPEATVKELFEKYMSKLDWKIKKQLDNLKNLLLIISTTQLYDDKALGYLINQFDHILKSQVIVSPLPEETVKFGNYDVLPERLEKGKQAAMAELLQDDD